MNMSSFNPLQGFGKPNAYIATQGNDSACIVMVIIINPCYGLMQDLCQELLKIFGK